MQNLKDYFSQLSQRDRALLILALALFTFVIFKLIILDGLASQKKSLNSRATQVQEYSALMQSVSISNNGQNIAGLASNELITSFLKKNNISEKLKQIRTTNKGEQRFEIEDIEFTQLIELFSVLDKNGSSYSSLQIKNRKIPGLVNTVLIMTD